jgi:hypothetical protein
LGARCRRFESVHPDQDFKHLADEAPEATDDKGKTIAQSSGVTDVQAGSPGRNERAEATLAGVLDAVESALDAGDVERAKRLIAVVRELQALGFGKPRDGE